MKQRMETMSRVIKSAKASLTLAAVVSVVTFVLLTVQGCGMGGGGGTDSGPGGTQLDLSGNWDFQFTITHAEGVCAGDINSVSNDTIHIVHLGSNVTLSGFVGLNTNELTGTVNSGAITFSGVNQEDGGETTTSYTGNVIDENNMDLTESWSWTNGVNSCPNGTAHVVATRIL